MQVTGCELYVADRYVGWQEATLNFLASQFDSKTRSFPATWVKELTEAVKVSGKAGDMSDKALKQTVIPFAKVKADEAQKGGAQVRSLWHTLLLQTASSGVTFQTAGLVLLLCIRLCLLTYALNHCICFAGQHLSLWQDIRCTVSVGL